MTVRDLHFCRQTASRCDMATATVRSRQRRSKPPAPILARLKPTQLPANPSPMLCTLVDEPFDHPSWIFEPKFDGLRVLGRFDGRKLTLLSRNNRSQNL